MLIFQGVLKLGEMILIFSYGFFLEQNEVALKTQELQLNV